MASSNMNNQSAGSFSFVTPIKLGNKNFIVWRAHILTLIKGNCLESFINSNRPCPVQFLPHETTGARSSTGSTTIEVNPDFITWTEGDQFFKLDDVIDSTKLTLDGDHCTTSKELLDMLTGMILCSISQDAT